MLDISLVMLAAGASSRFKCPTKKAVFKAWRRAALARGGEKFEQFLPI